MRRQPLYVPTWWERRFPWVEEILIRLDPGPLGARLKAIFGPLWIPIELLCYPVDRGLDALASALRAVRTGVGGVLASVMCALPLPRCVRCWLWIGPVRLRDGDDCAQMLLRRQAQFVRPAALTSAVLVHAAIFTLGPELHVEASEVVSEELIAIELPPAVDIPPPPSEIQRPAAPVVTTVALNEDVTIPKTTWKEFTPSVLPPPPPPPEKKRVENGPTFTPFTVAPVMQNGAEIARLMNEIYPDRLRDAGISGEVMVWARVDEEGRVTDVRVAESSGHESLDTVALDLAPQMRFSPAINRDVVVAVWIQLPLQFNVR